MLERDKLRGMGFRHFKLIPDKRHQEKMEAMARWGRRRPGRVGDGRAPDARDVSA